MRHLLQILRLRLPAVADLNKNRAASRAARPVMRSSRRSAPHGLILMIFRGYRRGEVDCRLAALLGDASLFKAGTNRDITPIDFTAQ